jgi:MYXO-CTERM domain-containing protein
MKTTRKSLPADTLGRLARYSSLAGAGLAATSAQASITVWDDTNWNLNGSNTADTSTGTDSVFFDFENGQVANDPGNTTRFDFELQVASSTNPYNGAVYQSAFVVPAIGYNSMIQSQNFPALLVSGDAIGASRQFGSAGLLATQSGAGNWLGTDIRGYLGLKFKLDPQSAQTYYGWADITVDYPSSGDFSITLHSFAYNDVDGQKILAGQTAVPEPDTVLPMGLLVLGAAGLSRYRRRKCA